MKPRVSVCIPTYNGAQYIKECLESVLAQTFTDFEILIIDDKSSDETLNILKEYATSDSRIKVLVNERNLGLVGNWNRCVELAQGEWIKFVFQDDLISSNCLERMLAECRTEIPIICCRRQFLFEANTPESRRKEYQKFLTYLSLESVFYKKTEISARDFSEAVLDHIGANFIGEPTATMLHRNVFYRFGFFNPYLTQICDFEFWTRVAIYTGITYVPETLATFRIHEKSTTAINKENHKQLLDEIILLHDFAFHPVYAPLRVAAQQRSSLTMYNYWTSDNLVNLLADKAYDLRKVAKCTANNPTDLDSKMLENWTKILQLYPLLSTFSKRSFPKRIIIHIAYRWKQLRKHFSKLLKRSAKLTEH